MYRFALPLFTSHVNWLMNQRLHEAPLRTTPRCAAPRPSARQHPLAGLKLRHLEADRWLPSQMVWRFTRRSSLKCVARLLHSNGLSLYRFIPNKSRGSMLLPSGSASKSMRNFEKHLAGKLASKVAAGGTLQSFSESHNLESLRLWHVLAIYSTTMAIYNYGLATTPVVPMALFIDTHGAGNQTRIGLRQTTNGCTFVWSQKIITLPNLWFGTWGHNSKRCSLTFMPHLSSI